MKYFNSLDKDEFDKYVSNFMSENKFEEVKDLKKCT